VKGRRRLWLALCGVAVLLALCVGALRTAQPLDRQVAQIAKAHGMVQGDAAGRVWTTYKLDAAGAARLYADLDAWAEAHGVSRIESSRWIDPATVQDLPIDGSFELVDRDWGDFGFSLRASESGITTIRLRGRTYTLTERVQRWWDDRHAE
jgi:hypothetical protein